MWRRLTQYCPFKLTWGIIRKWIMKWMWMKLKWIKMKDTSAMQLFWFESNCKITEYITERLQLIYTMWNVSVDVVIFASFVVGTGLNFIWPTLLTYKFLRYLQEEFSKETYYTSWEILTIYLPINYPLTVFSLLIWHSTIIADHSALLNRLTNMWGWFHFCLTL